MGFDGGAAVAAGLIGGAAMGVLLYMGIAMMPRQMKMNLFLMLGTMMARDGTVAYAGGGATFRGKTVTYATGAMIHAGMSAVFGLIHVGFITAFGLETSLAAWGVLFGFVHWIVVGMGLGTMRLMHPLIRNGDMEAPGPFALGYPPMTVVGFFMLHILFGVVVGALYTAFA